MQFSQRRLVSMNLGAAIGLLVAGMACQLVVEVSDYRFDDPDAGAELYPPPRPGALGEPSETNTDRPRPALDAGTSGALEPPPEEASVPPLLEPEPPADAEAEVVPPEPEPEPPAPEPEPPAPEPELPPDPVSGCSVIEYCYAYQVEDTTDEERCRQLGCSLDEAVAECRAEVAAVCGTAPQPPFVMITLSGERVILN